MAFEVIYVDRRGAGCVATVPTAQRVGKLLHSLYKRRIDATAYRLGTRGTKNEEIVGESRKLDKRWIWWYDHEADDR